MSFFKICVVLSLPIAVAKALISLLHCGMACKMLEQIDLKERSDARQKESGKKIE